MQLPAEHSRVIDFGILDLDFVGLGVSGGTGEEKSPAREGWRWRERVAAKLSTRRMSDDVGTLKGWAKEPNV